MQTGYNYLSECLFFFLSFIGRETDIVSDAEANIIMAKWYIMLFLIFESQYIAGINDTL